MNYTSVTEPNPFTEDDNKQFPSVKGISYDVCLYCQGHDPKYQGRLHTCIKLMTWNITNNVFITESTCANRLSSQKIFYMFVIIVNVFKREKEMEEVSIKNFINTHYVVNNIQINDIQYTNLLKIYKTTKTKLCKKTYCIS